MAFIVIAHVGCENLHLTEVPMVSPVLANGEVQGMLGSSADYCDICDGSTEILELVAREVPEDYPNLDVHVLRHEVA